MNLTPAIKAQAIARAVYTATGIQATVIERPGRPPLVSFSPDNRRQIQDFLRKLMAQKSDVEIDVLPVVLPLMIQKIALPAAVAIGALFFAGYIIGKEF